MGKISRQVLPKGGRRGNTGLKGKIHRSVSRVPVKKTIVRDRTQDYHGVDKLEVRGGAPCNYLIANASRNKIQLASSTIALSSLHLNPSSLHEPKHKRQPRGTPYYSSDGVGSA
jgi:hypothetical protein